MKQIVNLVLVILLILTSVFTLPASAAELNSGAEIFNFHCAGCHINGGNIVRRGKTLQKKALKRYGMDSIEAIAAIVTNGKNNMSAYKDRLSEQQIQVVAAYVLEQAEKGWR